MTELVTVTQGKERWWVRKSLELNYFIAHDQRQIRQNALAGVGMMQGLSTYIVAIEQTDWTPSFRFLLSFSLSFHRTVTNDQTEISKRHLLPNLYYALQAAAE